MHNTTVGAHTPEKSRTGLWGRSRIVAMAGLFMAVITAVLAGPGSTPQAHAAGHVNVCTFFPTACHQVGAPHRGTRPSNITPGEWTAATEAANLWSSHSVNNTGNHDQYGADQLLPAPQGWPGDVHGRNWTFYRDSLHNIHYIFYGGVYQDRSLALQHQETAWGVSTAHATGGRTGAYREYDVFVYGHPVVARGTARIVRNINTGHVYVTFDHYNTFHYLGQW